MDQINTTILRQKMKHLNKILLIAGIVLLVHACYEDKGSYDYIDLNEVYVDTTGVSLSYSISQYDTLSITPNIKFALFEDDTSNLEYKWVIYKDVWSKDESEIEVLSTNRNLKVQIQQSPNSDAYAVVLYITNTTDQTVSQVKYTVNILPSIVSGMVILHTNSNGESDLDYIATTNAVPTLDTLKWLHNIYSSVNETKISGIPNFVSASRVNNTVINYIYVGTNEEFLLIDATDFALLHENQEMFKSQPGTILPQFANHGQRCNNVTILINNGQIHNINNQASQYWDYQFSQALKPASSFANEIDLAPFVYFADECAASVGHAAIMYDNIGKRFVRIPFSFWEEEEIIALPEQNSSNKFDVNKIGKDILFLGKGFNGHAFAVFKDGDNRELYRANFNKHATFYDEDLNEIENEEIHKLSVNKYDLSEQDEIYDAKFYDCGPLGNFFLYASEKNIYSYSYASSTKVATKINDPFSSNEVITAMKIYNTDWFYPLDGVNGTLLYVATWDGIEGRLYEFKINRASGYLNNKEETDGTVNLKAPTHVFTRFGKINDMCVKLEGIDE